MPELQPKTSAELAEDIYLIQDERTSKVILSRPVFSQKKDSSQKLVATVGFRVLKNYQDGFGLCALGGGIYENDLFLIFRGSTKANNGADWISNARIGSETSSTGVQVHIGFNSIFQSMKREIAEFVDTHAISGTIHCIGHSLGGAVASLAADWVKSYKANNKVTLYTFGAPRPAFSQFAKHLSNKLGNENIHRTFHTTDPVPMIPIFPFVHPPMPGLGHCIETTDAILSASAHDISYYGKSVEGHSEWGTLTRRQPQYNFESAIEEWLRSKSPVNGNSYRIWQWIDSALIYVLKKLLGGVMAGLQLVGMGIVSIADKIALLFQKGLQGIKAVANASFYVVQLMKKITQALGMKVAKTAKELTHTLMRNILIHLMNRMNEEARKAVRKINRF